VDKDLTSGARRRRGVRPACYRRSRGSPRRALQPAEEEWQGDFEMSRDMVCCSTARRCLGSNSSSASSRWLTGLGPKAVFVGDFGQLARPRGRGRPFTDLMRPYSGQCGGVS